MPEPSDEFVLRVSNWVRWCRASGSSQGHCGSIEYRYLSPQGKGHPTGWGDYTEQVVVRGSTRLDVQDAMLLDCAYRRLCARSRRVLKLVYFKFNLRRQWLASKVGVHVDALDERIRSVLCEFESEVAECQTVR